MQIYGAILKLYEELFRQTSLNNTYKFIPNKVDKLLTIRFIKWIYNKYHKAEVGADLLIQYFEFQFSHYVGMKTKFNKLIMYNWIVGKKAQERWENRDLRFKWIVKVKIKNELNLDLHNSFISEKIIKKLSFRQDIILKLNDVEEHHKKRFFNQYKGFLYCQMFTTLYNPKSELCLVCTNKDICTETLKINLPKIHKLRITNG